MQSLSNLPEASVFDSRFIKYDSSLEWKRRDRGGLYALTEGAPLRVSGATQQPTVRLPAKPKLWTGEEGSAE